MAMISRRGFVTGALSTGALACGRGPKVRTSVPHVTHGVAAGDVQSGTAIVWARCDEAAWMEVEWDTTDRFEHPRRAGRAFVKPDGDFAGKIAIDGLPMAQTIAYRVRFDREAARGTSAWSSATFQTPRTDRMRFAWTGDTCGQGYGRNPEWGGLRGYAAIREAHPAFLLHSGDLIYADNPILPEQKLADGRVWKNISNEHVARVAETLDDFRARFQYNLEDEHVRALAAEVPIVAQWDDHETHNNWWPGQILDDDRYHVQRDASILAGFARRAMFEWTAIPPGPFHRTVSYGPLLDVIVLDCRSFRSPNDSGAGLDMLGSEQARWFADALVRSKARWKIVACDQPIGLVIGDGPDNSRFEGFANREGPPSGREREIAAVLAHAVPNVVWLTADVHYAAAHHYDPARANGVSFEPFWEFVAGPIHAGTFGPNALDPTFGPEVRFQWAPPKGMGNLAPWDGLQSFGTVDVTSDALAVAILGIDGSQKFRVEIPWRS